MRRFRLVVIAVLSLLIIVIAIQNRQPVETNILFATVIMPRVLLLIGTAAIGFVLGLVTALVLGRRRKPE